MGWNLPERDVLMLPAPQTPVDEGRLKHATRVSRPSPATPMTLLRRPKKDPCILNNQEYNLNRDV